MIDNERIGPGGGPVGPGGLEVDYLSGVKLVSFTATPDLLGPFGASRLQWEITGAALGGVNIWLNGLPAAAVASRIVQPMQTTEYTLSATQGAEPKVLGSVVVRVNVAACVEREYAIFNILRAGMEVEIDSRTGVMWSPAVKPEDRLKLYVDGDKIVYYAHFIQKIWGPNAHVTLQGSFRLGVENARLVAWDMDWDSEVDLSSLSWLWSTIMDDGRVAAGRAEARQSSREVIDELVAGIARFIGEPEPGMRLRSARAAEGAAEGDLPSIFITVCPDAELNAFAALLAKG